MASSNVWNGGGHPYSHSRLVDSCSMVETFRFEDNASQIIKTIRITAVSEINEPIDEIMFHVV